MTTLLICSGIIIIVLYVYQHTRRKIKTHNIDIPPTQPYYFTIKAEHDTILHDIASNRTILEEVQTDDTHSTFYATKEDMIEHMAHMEYSRGEIQQEEKKRLGYTKKGKKRS